MTAEDETRHKAKAGNPNKLETGMGTSTAAVSLGQGQDCGLSCNEGHRPWVLVCKVGRYLKSNNGEVVRITLIIIINCKVILPFSVQCL